MATWRESGRGMVFPWLCDQFGHMNVRWYAAHFDDASFQVWPLVGLGPAEFEKRGVVAVVASTKIDFVREIHVGRAFVMRSGFVRVGGKSVTYMTRMFDAESGTLHAVNEATEVFFDPRARKAAPMPDDMRAVLERNLVDPKGP
jgi:acyl-CoA thioester hydrolase